MEHRILDKLRNEYILVTTNSRLLASRMAGLFLMEGVEGLRSRARFAIATNSNLTGWQESLINLKRMYLTKRR